MFQNLSLSHCSMINHSISHTTVFIKIVVGERIGDEWCVEKLNLNILLNLNRLPRRYAVLCDLLATVVILLRLFTIKLSNLAHPGPRCRRP